MRSNTLDKLEITPEGGATATIPNRALGQGTSFSIANPTEEMASGFSREVMHQVDFTVESKERTIVSAYDKAFIRTNDGTVPVLPYSGGSEWDDLGRLDNEGSIAYNPVTTQDGALRTLYKSVNIEALINALDETKKATIDSYRDTRVDLILQRTDRSFKVFYDVLLTLPSWNPTTGSDQLLTSRLRTVAAAYDLTDHVKKGEAYQVTGVDTTAGTFTVAVDSDVSSQFTNGDTFVVDESTGNDGEFTVSSSTYDSTNSELTITVNESVSDGTADGYVLILLDLDNALYTMLNAAQRNGTLLTIVGTMLDGSTITIKKGGFSCVPMEEFASATLEGFLIEGMGISNDEPSVIDTAAP